MNIFVSSTVYDLLDIRAELCELLTELKTTPILSEDPLTGFDASYRTNSIETCLINVEKADQVVIILDKRYGPPLPIEFGEVSATHLEYRRAKELGKPIHFFVRDRLEADYTTYKKNPEARLAWIDRKDIGLLELLAEHRRLDPNIPSSNWVTFFRSSIDLKQCVRRKLEKHAKEQALAEALADNSFPIFSSKFTPEIHSKEVKFRLGFKNVSKSTAFNLHVNLEKIPPGSTIAQAIIPPGEELFQVILTVPPRDEVLTTIEIQYDSMLGIHVREHWELGHERIEDKPSSVTCGISLLIRNFYFADKPIIPVIHEVGLPLHPSNNISK